MIIVSCACCIELNNCASFATQQINIFDLQATSSNSYSRIRRGDNFAGAIDLRDLIVRANAANLKCICTCACALPGIAIQIQRDVIRKRRIATLGLIMGNIATQVHNSVAVRTISLNCCLNSIKTITGYFPIVIGQNCDHSFIIALGCVGFAIDGLKCTALNVIIGSYIGATSALANSANTGKLTAQNLDRTIGRKHICGIRTAGGSKATIIDIYLAVRSVRSNSIDTGACGLADTGICTTVHIDSGRSFCMQHHDFTTTSGFGMGVVRSDLCGALNVHGTTLGTDAINITITVNIAAYINDSIFDRNFILSACVNIYSHRRIGLAGTRQTNGSIRNCCILFNSDRIVLNGSCRCSHINRTIGDGNITFTINAIGRASTTGHNDISAGDGTGAGFDLNTARSSNTTIRPEGTAGNIQRTLRIHSVEITSIRPTASSLIDTALNVQGTCFVIHRNVVTDDLTALTVVLQGQVAAIDFHTIGTIRSDGTTVQVDGHSGINDKLLVKRNILHQLNRIVSIGCFNSLFQGSIAAILANNCAGSQNRCHRDCINGFAPFAIIVRKQRATFTSPVSLMACQIEGRCFFLYSLRMICMIVKIDRQLQLVPTGFNALVICIGTLAASTHIVCRTAGGQAGSFHRRNQHGAFKIMAISTSRIATRGARAIYKGMLCLDDCVCLLNLLRQGFIAPVLTADITMPVSNIAVFHGFADSILRRNKLCVMAAGQLTAILFPCFYRICITDHIALCIHIDIAVIALLVLCPAGFQTGRSLVPLRGCILVDILEHSTIGMLIVACRNIAGNIINRIYLELTTSNIKLSRCKASR